MGLAIEEFVRETELSATEEGIVRKIVDGQRISDDDAAYLFYSSNLELVGALAHFIRVKRHGFRTYFNRNFHIEPTNICIYECSFCSFARKPGEEGGWEYTLEEIEEIINRYKGTSVTEAHIVGGVHPKRGVEYYSEMLRRIKKIMPALHIKAFTAVELKVMFARSKMSIEEGLSALKEAGLGSIPGGGAEIFDEKVREKICGTKASSEEWLSIHEAAHKLGIPSNATILYGHVERYEDRIDHLSRLRALQDRTEGFQTFIPLKFRNENNSLSYLGEITTDEDLKNYAVSRIYLDNIDHLKAYWPMIGKETTRRSLSFGVDDIDGTIDDTTKIYSMAGAEDQHPAMNTAELVKLVRDAGFTPLERDTLYNVVREY